MHTYMHNTQNEPEHTHKGKIGKTKVNRTSLLWERRGGKIEVHPSRLRVVWRVKNVVLIEVREEGNFGSWEFCEAGSEMGMGGRGGGWGSPTATLNNATIVRDGACSQWLFSSLRAVRETLSIFFYFLHPFLFWFTRRFVHVPMSVLYST